MTRAFVPARGLSVTFAGISVAAGLAAFLSGTAVESAVIRAVHGDRPRLEWISDVVVSAGVVGLMYLWLHLRESRTRLLSLEREQGALDEQLRLAAEIQRNLLPGAPPDAGGLSWAAQMVPAGRIGGDFYDHVQGPDGTVLCIVADVSGKGIPAALILSALKVLFRSFASRTREPATIAARLSAALHDGYSGMPYATAMLARFDGLKRRMTYVNAGHPPGYVLRARETIALESASFPLGLLPDATYTEATLDLEPGDVVVILTDGVTEALETGAITLAQGLGTVRDLVAREASPAVACGALLRAAGEGGGPAGIEGWQDDRTVLVAVVDRPVGGV